MGPRPYFFKENLMRIEFSRSSLRGNRFYRVGDVGEFAAELAHRIERAGEGAATHKPVTEFESGKPEPQPEPEPEPQAKPPTPRRRRPRKKLEE